MDVYAIVTERIIKQLEEGYIPWKKPWLTFNEGAFNRVSRKPYSLLNQMLLSKKGEYATFKQWTSLGGKIKKGAKAEIVVFWKILKNVSADESDPDDADKITVRTVPILKYYNVFHISDVEGVEPLDTESEFYDTKPIDQAEKLFRDYTERESIKVDISPRDRAFYNPTMDSISLPVMEQFKSAEEFYSTAFHEATHSTLKKSRCDREAENQGAFFGNDDYSKEELVAEIGSSSIMNSLGLETENTFKNNAAYIQSWLKVLKNDKKFIISASSKAEKAVNYICGDDSSDEVLDEAV